MVNGAPGGPTVCVPGPVEEEHAVQAETAINPSKCIDTHTHTHTHALNQPLMGIHPQNQSTRILFKNIEKYIYLPQRVFKSI